jgi:uncharacterized protein YjdB
MILKGHMAMADIDTTITSSGNNADLVRQIKQYALFLYAAGEDFTMPTSLEWTPGAKKSIGYSSEDGVVIHPEPGDDTEIKAHNGDVVISENSGGYWTLQLAGIESRKEVVEAYFGVKVSEDGGIHVTDASTPQKWGLVLVALDQNDQMIVIGAEKAQVSDRDDMTLSTANELQYNMTFKFFKGKDGNMFNAYGMVLDETETANPGEPDAVAVESVTLTPATASVEAGKTTQLSASVTPDDATDSSVAYTSDDEAIATVDERGLVTGVSAGSATITVTTTDGAKTSTADITVTAAE